jgi:hypothetical protein
VAVIKYDNSNVEPSQFKQPTPGLYTCRIEEINHRTEDGKNDLEVVLVVDGGEFDKAMLWTYIGLGEAAGWKMLEFTDALGLPAKGSLDTKKIINKKIKVKVNGDQYQGEYRARVGRLAPLSATPEADEVEAEQEVEDASATASDAGAEVEDDYDDWDEGEHLSAIQEDEELGPLYPGGHDDDTEWLIGFLRAADRGELGEWLEENHEAEEVDYSTWETGELKAELERRGLPVPNRAPKAKLIKALEEADAEGGDPFEEE